MEVQPEGFPPWERPVRIPERIAIRQTEPEFALSLDRGSWSLPFELAEDLPPGSTVKLQLFGGRNNKVAFQGAQTERPDDEGYLTAQTLDGTPLPVEPSDGAGTFDIAVPEGGLSSGTILEVEIGRGSGRGAAIRAPATRMLNKFFVLYRVPTDGRHRIRPQPARGADWSEENQRLIVGACRMHILGGAIHHLRAYVPSQATPGEPIDVLVRPEDERSNLSHRTPGEIAVLLGGEELPAKVEAVPDSTCVRVQIRLPREGVHRLTVTDRRTGRETQANPVLCTRAAADTRVFWGMIHGHTEMSDGTGSLEYYFRQIRDEAGLDFAAPGDHDHLWETPDAFWRITSNTVARWNDPGRFVVFLGYEWAKWRQNGDGDRNVYYLHDHRPMYRSDDGNYPSPPDLFEALRGETAIVIPHHTGHAGNFCDWKDHAPERERLVEIYQTRGSYETSEEEGNPVPERAATPPVPTGYVCRALAMGWRVGFTAGGDDHAGHAGTEFPADRPDRYKAGLMAVEAEARTRPAIWRALWNRRVVATTGPRMLLTWRLNGHPMGAELSAAAETELAERRRLDIEFHGTAGVERVDVIRNNDVVKTFSPAGMDHRLRWEDTAPLHEVCLPPARFCPNPFCFYYIRVTQTDGEVAWASPIWIDP
ncbi:MAG: DUF3604 domain-containing protein [Candidatus Brocadiae bacterium]|nr:DUF3604 domain-containing protein [Candidatus Brocadiia bacterium]